MEETVDRYAVIPLRARGLWTLYHVTYTRRPGTSLYDPAASELLGTYGSEEEARAARADYPATPLDQLREG